MSRDSIVNHLNDQDYVIFSTQPQGSLNWFDEDIAIISSWFKRRGVFAPGHEPDVAPEAKGSRSALRSIPPTAFGPSR